MTPPVPHRPRPAIRRAIMALPFVAALALAARWNDEPLGTATDPGRPGFALRDETAASGIRFVHRRATLDPKLANIEPHVAAVGAGVSVADVDGDGWPDLYFTNSRFGERTRSIEIVATAPSRRSRRAPASPT